MIPTTTRELRRLKLAERGPEFFENDEDHYIYLHLNDRVQLAHSLGFVIALGIFVASIVLLSWKLFVLQYLVSTGSSVGAHWYFDGFIPSGPRKTPFRVLVFGMKKNFAFLFGRSRRVEEAFLSKYPFARDAYLRDSEKAEEAGASESRARATQHDQESRTGRSKGSSRSSEGFRPSRDEPLLFD